MTLPSGEVKTKRIIVRKFRREFTIPLKISYALIKNVGLTDIKMSFGEDNISDFIVLEKQDKLPVLGVRGGFTKITHESLLDDGVLELLLWG